MMKVFGFKWVFLCALLTAVYPKLALSADQLKPKTQSKYHYLVTSQDLYPIRADGSRGDGKYDTWNYKSYGGDTLKIEYDYNGDGKVDSYEERIRIKNLELHVRDRDFDGLVDHVLFDFGGGLQIIKEDLNVQIDQATPKILEHFMNQLEAPQKKAVLSKMTVKYDELQSLLDDALANRDDEKKLRLFEAKVREYLDFPDNEFLPIIHIRLVDELNQSQHALYSIPVSHLEIGPAVINGKLDLWLATLDHELLHALQSHRLYTFLTKTLKVDKELMFSDYVYMKNYLTQKVKFRPSSQALRDAYTAIGMVFSQNRQRPVQFELEAYMQTYQRRYFYSNNGFNEPTAELLESVYVTRLHGDILQDGSEELLPFMRHVIQDSQTLWKETSHLTPEVFTEHYSKFKDSVLKKYNLN